MEDFLGDRPLLLLTLMGSKIRGLRRKLRVGSKEALFLAIILFMVFGKQSSLLADRGIFPLEADASGNFFSVDLAFNLFAGVVGGGVTDFFLLVREALEKDSDRFRFRNFPNFPPGECGPGDPGPWRVLSIALCRILAIWLIMSGVGLSRHSASLARITSPLSFSNLFADMSLRNRSTSSPSSSDVSPSDKRPMEEQAALS